MVSRIWHGWTTPDNADAYLERGGAYFRMGQYEPAMADARKAADLGNPQAEEIYQRYRHVLGQ